MVFVIKWIFSNPYFLLKMDQEIVLFEDSEKKETFLEKNNVASKNHQNFHFFKAVSAWVLKKKNGCFLTFSFYAKWIKK